jgi:hypothetical protein
MSPRLILIPEVNQEGGLGAPLSFVLSGVALYFVPCTSSCTPLPARLRIHKITRQHQARRAPFDVA